jgi:pyruvate/2-oxoacid:ferredoxin oxidoreductase alpha subunit
MEAKYKEAERKEIRAERWRTDDAEFILVGYGIMGRVLKSVVELGRARGMALGLLRPITLFPFPGPDLRELCRRAKGFLVVELSTGQMADDVRLALEGRAPVEQYGRVGGVVPSAEEILAVVQKTFSLTEEEVLTRG